MIDTSTLDVKRDEVSDKYFVVDGNDRAINEIGYALAQAWAYLAGMAKEQVRHQKAKIERLEAANVGHNYRTGYQTGLQDGISVARAIIQQTIRQETEARALLSGLDERIGTEADMRSDQTSRCGYSVDPLTISRASESVEGS